MSARLTPLEVKELRDRLLRDTETDTLDRELTRAQRIFDIFYDDDEGEPDQAIRDALTNLMHMAAERGVDMEEAVTRAASMWSMEREDWGVDE